MVFLRSLLFTVVALAVTPVYAIIACLMFALPTKVRHRIITSYAHVMMWWVRHMLGIRYTVLGRENIPAVPVVIVSKHQSAWETLALQVIFPPLCFVLKRELLRIPFLGWGLAQLPSIAIDRSAGKDALTQVIEQGCERLAEGISVVIFPEGTRVAPGMHRRYKPGGAALAARSGAPVVPVAHNAGEFWPRNAFLKQPGNIVMSIGPPIDTAGRSIAEVNDEVEAWIEGEMHRLFPHHY